MAASWMQAFGLRGFRQIVRSGRRLDSTQAAAPNNKVTNGIEFLKELGFICLVMSVPAGSVAYDYFTSEPKERLPEDEGIHPITRFISDYLMADPAADREVIYRNMRYYKQKQEEFWRQKHEPKFPPIDKLYWRRQGEIMKAQELGDDSY